mmetsp:Transcript_25426/g.59175  ORF Transcript_25426/g.59175 Transcript_25426/m.59175 type:complete len:278 (+) Transcript_25426:37-870(+)
MASDADASAVETDVGVVIHEGSAHSRKVLYGNILWDGALSLSMFCTWAEQQAVIPPFHGKLVLELGAGTGVVGLTAGKLGASVYITDFEPELVTLMEQNIAANALQGKVQAKLLDWRDPSTYLDAQPFDVIVAADVLYQGDGSDLAATVAAHIPPGSSTVAYVANHHNPQKCKATLGFLRSAVSMGLTVQRLQDDRGRALGSLPDECSTDSKDRRRMDAAALFANCSWASLTPPATAEQGWPEVQWANMASSSQNPLLCIQIFRLSRSAAACTPSRL